MRCWLLPLVAIFPTVTPGVIRFPEFVDFTLRVDLEQEDENTVHGLADVFPIEKNDGATFCFQLERGRSVFGKNVKKDVTKDAVHNYVQPVVMDKPTTTMTCDQRRNGTHQALTRVERKKDYPVVDPTMFMEKVVSDDLKPDPIQYVRGKKLMAAMFFHRYYDDTIHSKVFPAVTAVAENPNVTLHTGADLKSLAPEIAKYLWKSIQMILGNCTYVGDRSMCVYDSQQECRSERAVVESKDIYVHYADVCASGAVNPPCSDSECDSLCANALDRAPCRGDCEEGTKNLFMDGDQWTKYCDVLSKGVEQKQCSFTCSRMPQPKSHTRSCLGEI